MSVRVGVNGFGRIGRNFFRAATERGVDIDVVAVNDVGSRETMAHLLKYDSVLGILPQDIRASKNGIKVGSDELLVLSERDPKELPWDDLGVDLVIESTGIFTSREKAATHLDAGAPLVLGPPRVTAPTERSSTGSTTRTSTPRPSRSSRPPAAPPTASCRWSRCSTTPSASSRA